MDDEPAVRSLIRSILERDGYDVEEAGDGDEGLAVYARDPADLVIVDLVMPRTNGVTVIAKLRDSYPKVRVIPMTGALASLCESERMADVFGGQCLLVKPLVPDEILVAVFELLGFYRRADGRETWHWSQACSRWPTACYFKWQGKPATGEFCIECREKDTYRRSAVLDGVPSTRS